MEKKKINIDNEMLKSIFERMKLSRDKAEHIRGGELFI